MAMPEIPVNISPDVPRPPIEIEPSSPEVTVERPSVTPEQSLPTSPAEVAPLSQSVVPLAPIVPYEMQVQRQVENILSEGLEQVYQGLDEATKAKVKMSGEQTAAQITSLLQETKVQVKKILQLIIAWLLGFPGLNKHYSEQAAKIKADKLLLTKTFRS